MSSSTSSTSSLFTPLQFTGISQFSSDFQTILSRAVSIAQLPLQRLQNQDTDIIQEQLQLSNIGSAVANVATSLQALGKLGSTKALAASTTDSAVVSATVTGATAPTSYQISNISSIASNASETSQNSYPGTVSTSGVMKLVYGNKTYTLNLTASNNNLAGVRDAINALPNAGVTATILTTSNGNYLSVTADTPGKTTLQLLDEPNVLTSSNQGSATTSASETSTATYADATTAQVSATGKMTLAFGGQNYPISLDSSHNNLNGLVDAINGLNAGVTASAAQGSDGKYSLTITANATGATTLQLLDDPTTANNILTSTNQGANTTFKLNGVTVDEPSTTINDVISGVTLSFTGKSPTSGETIGVKLSSDETQISSALQQLVTNYNAIADQVSAQRGTTAGLLTGNNIVYQIRAAMSNLVQYQGSGSMGNLANLGIEMGTDGHMSFNQDTFNALSDSQISQAFTLLGSSTSGIGALQKAFTSISDPATGSIQSQQAQWKTTEQRLTNQIATMTDNINSMQQSLNKKLQAADALAAKLASQQSMLSSDIYSLNYTTYGRNYGGQ